MGYGKAGITAFVRNFGIQHSKMLGMGLGFLALTGCNPFALVDTPSGDTQVLAAARACFDKGDFTCASKYYGQLSSVASDSTNSEGAFQALAQNGATMGAFMNAAVNGGTSGGKFLTQLANSLASGAGQTRRLAIFHAYQRWDSISDTSLKNLVRFLTAASLLAEILAEDAGTNGLFETTDWVTTPTTCLTKSGTLYVDAACLPPSGKAITAGAVVSLSSTTADSVMTGSPTLGMINGALQEVNNGLSNISLTGGIGSTTQSFANQVLNNNAITTTDNGAFRGFLLSLDLGVQ